MSVVGEEEEMDGLKQQLEAKPVYYMYICILYIYMYIIYMEGFKQQLEAKPVYYMYICILYIYAYYIYGGAEAAARGFACILCIYM